MKIELTKENYRAYLFVAVILIILGIVATWLVFRKNETDIKTDINEAITEQQQVMNYPVLYIEDGNYYDVTVDRELTQDEKNAIIQEIEKVIESDKDPITGKDLDVRFTIEGSRLKNNDSLKEQYEPKSPYDSGDPDNPFDPDDVILD